MRKAPEITCVFLDIAGLLLTDGWDRYVRERAATNFKLELAEIEDRHHLTWDTYQEGKLTLEEYLGWVVFYHKRPFTRAQFRHLMFAQSKPYPEMIELVAQLKVQHRLKIALVSNEGPELNAFRIRKFKLDRFVDFLFPPALSTSSSPTRTSFGLPCTSPRRQSGRSSIKENTPMFAGIAEGLGIRSILHMDCRETRAKLTSFGLLNGEQGIHETR